MHARALIVAAALAVAAASRIALAQTVPTTVDGLVSAAKRSAGLEWPGTFLRLCVVPPPATGAGRGGAAANAKRSDRARHLQQSLPAAAAFLRPS